MGRKPIGLLLLLVTVVASLHFHRVVHDSLTFILRQVPLGQVPDLVRKDEQEPVRVRHFLRKNDHRPTTYIRDHALHLPPLNRQRRHVQDRDSVRPASGQQH